MTEMKSVKQTFADIEVGNRMLVKTELLPDTVILNNSTFSNIINHAVADWLTYTGPSLVSKELFLNYVLPYKLLEETPENWRPLVHRKYDTLVHRISKNDPAYQLKVIKAINEDLKTWFKFDATSSPESWRLLSQAKRGDCVAMAKTIAFAARTYGIPVCIDYCPVWTNINAGSHCWNALPLPNGKSVPFMGCESNPYEYNPFLIFKTTTGRDISTFKKGAKVLRQTFAINPDNLSSIVKEENIPWTLVNERYIDVTNEYYETGDIEVPISGNSRNQKVLYLCVYNNGEWLPTWWSRVEKRRAVFRQMARGVLYQPAYFTNGKVEPVGNPLILTASGLQYLNPHFKNKQLLRLKSFESTEQEQLNTYSREAGKEWKIIEKQLNAVAARKGMKSFEDKKTYTLYYWNKKWIPFSTKKSSGPELHFSNAPSNAMFKLVSADDYSGRNFTYENDEQQWW
jgi:hypothetical protein